MVPTTCILEFLHRVGRHCDAMPVRDDVKIRIRILLVSATQCEIADVSPRPLRLKMMSRYLPQVCHASLDFTPESPETCRITCLRHGFERSSIGIGPFSKWPRNEPALSPQFVFQFRLGSVDFIAQPDRVCGNLGNPGVVTCVRTNFDSG